MSDNIDFARNKGLIVALARALEASGAADVDEFVTYLEGAAAGFGNAATYDVGMLEGELAALGAGGKFDPSLLPDLAGAVWGQIGGTITDQDDLIGSSGKLLTSLIPDEVLSAMKYRGTWDAATNVRSPDGGPMPSANGSNKGHYYKVSVAGSTSLDGITDWKVGDWIISNGSTYDKIDNTDSVVSVAGLEGVISATALTGALNTFTRAAKGLVPASGGATGTTKFLREDGTFAEPGGGSVPPPYNWATATVAGSAVPDLWHNYTPNILSLSIYGAEISASTSVSKSVSPGTSSTSTSVGGVTYGNSLTTTLNPGCVLRISSNGYSNGTITFTVAP